MQQQRFDLNLDNANEKRLAEHLSGLAEDGEKGKWIVRTLVDALPPTRAETIKNALMRDAQLKQVLGSAYTLRDLEDETLRYVPPEDIP